MLTHAKPPQRVQSGTECWPTGKSDRGEAWWLKRYWGWGGWGVGVSCPALQKEQNVPENQTGERILSKKIKNIVEAFVPSFNYCLLMENKNDFT